MRALFYVHRLRFAAILFACLTAAQGATASTVPTKSGHVRYTTGTAVRTDKAPLDTEPLGFRSPDHDSGRWQVASVDASLVEGQSSLVGIKQATFELPSPPSQATAAVAAQQSTLSAGSSTTGREPGFWATSLSTLALGLFFFLRRLA